MKRFGLFLALLLCAIQAFAYEYTNKNLAFTVALPDGLTNVPSPLGGKYLVGLANLHVSREHPIIEVIVLNDMGSAIQQDFSTHTNAIDALSLPNAEWQGINLQVTRDTRQIYGDTMVCLDVQVPLKPNALEIRFVGQTKQEPELRADLDKVLDTVTGSTDWLTAGESGHGPGPYLICVFVGLFCLLTGSLRISPHCGVADSDARVAGFFIILAGVGLPYLDRVFSIAGWMHHLGCNYYAAIGAMVALNFLIIIAVTIVMVCIHGNLYANDANPLTYVAPKKLTKEEKKAASAPPDMSCPLCHKPVSSKLSSCPNCHADLVRWKEIAAAKATIATE